MYNTRTGKNSISLPGVHVGAGRGMGQTESGLNLRNISQRGDRLVLG